MQKKKKKKKKKSYHKWNWLKKNIHIKYKLKNPYKSEFGWDMSI